MNSKKSLNYKDNGGEKPITNLDKIKKIWEQILPHRKLKKSAGKIEAYPSGKKDNIYNASEMSDGERVILYIIGQVISVPENAIIILDEPEMHIHKSLIKKIFDLIEAERQDCMFIYLTHDIDFACSRQDAIKIWVKEYNGDTWDYEVIRDNNIPEDLYLEILGSRKPILFVEGKKGGIDEKLLEAVFSDNYTIIPVGSCEKVCSITKAFNEKKEFHNISAKGIIDRDRRTDEEILNIGDNIWVLEVAEIENLLLLEQIVKQVALDMHMSASLDSSCEKVKENVINFFEKEIRTQVLEHVKHKVERYFKKIVNKKSNNIDEFDNELSSYFNEFDSKKEYETIIEKFKVLVENKDYNGILKVFNNKGIISNSKVAEIFNLSSKRNTYFNHIIRMLKLNNDSSNIIKKEIIEYINEGK